MSFISGKNRNAIASSEKAAASGVATLDANSEVVQLPAGAAAAGAGSVLQQDGTWKSNQTIQTHVTTTSSQALTAGVRADITGLTATITPQSTSKRIKVSVRWNGESSITSNYEVVFGLRRNGTDIGNPAPAGSRPVGIAIIAQGYWTSDAGSTPDSAIYEYIDSPASTSAITYTATISMGNTNVLYNNRTVNDINTLSYERLTSTIILEEID